MSNTVSLTDPMKRAIMMFHGSAKSASEARADVRSVNALIDKGLLRWSSGPSTRKRYVLTPAGVDLYDVLEEPGL